MAVSKVNKLTIDDDYTPCPEDEGNELYLNGFFVLNITRIIKYLEANRESNLSVEVAVADFPESYVEYWNCKRN